jgi:MYXO-CTERM domain-containing protein
MTDFLSLVNSKPHRAAPAARTDVANYSTEHRDAGAIGPAGHRDAIIHPPARLETPGLAAPNYANARFTMTAVALLTPLPFASLGPGQIDLWDSSNNLLMTITFSGGLLSSSFGFGSSEFQGNNVTFSGPILGGDVFTNEAFAFSFANPVATQTGYQATASFTSSANVPAPAGLAALAMGGLAIGRRRRA